MSQDIKKPVAPTTGSNFNDDTPKSISGFIIPSPPQKTSGQKSDLEHQRKLAINFCHLIKDPNVIIDFRTFDDNSDRKDSSLVRKLRGTIEEHLETLLELNRRGAGIFFTVNTTDGLGVSNSNITSIEYLWIEDDGDAPDAVSRCPLTPCLKVKTSVGHYHHYFKVEPNSIKPADFKQYQSVMAEKYGSDTNALDASRVLRVAGFYHQKVNSKKGLVGGKQLVEVCND